MLTRKTRYMDRIVREAIEIEVTLTISTERVASMEA
jgi:hypothetical protein